MSPTAPHPSIAALGPALGPAIGRHLDVAFRAVAQGPGVASEPSFLRVFSGEAHPLGNFAVLSKPADTNDARTAVEPLAAAPVPSVVLFPDLDVPADFAAYLAARGYARHGGLPAMGIDIARLASTRLPEGYEFVRIDDGADADEWVRQFARGYELPVGVARYFAPHAVAAPDAASATLEFFAVRKEGAIVATSACYLSDGLAGIYCVATVPEERGKGLGAHATAEPLRRAAARGYGVGVLQSSEAGFSVYRRLGFAAFGAVPLFLRVPG